MYENWHLRLDLNKLNKKVGTAAAAGGTVPGVGLFRISEPDSRVGLTVRRFC